jgi:hypothetical protein
LILKISAMSKEQTKDLAKLLKTFDKEVINLVMWLREFAWDLCPKANELIYDNYNALSIGWSVTDKVGHAICSIAVFRSNQNIHFGFYWGNELSDPDKILIGEGVQYRYILVTDKKKFPKTYITKLVNEAYANSLSKVKDQKQIIQGRTILKSVSAKKRDRTKK